MTLKMRTWHFLIAYFKWYVDLPKTFKYKTVLFTTQLTEYLFDAVVTENFLNGLTFHAVKLTITCISGRG